MGYQRMVTSLALAVAALLSGCTQRPEPSRTTGRESEADSAAIRGLFERYDSTVTAGLGEEWMSLLWEDIIWMVPNQPSLEGKEAVWGRVGPFFADLDMDIVSTLDEVKVAGDWAYVRGTYTFRVTPKAGGETTEEVGKIVYILGRQADNSWRITRAIWNANHPVP
ncbi:MAG: YybH family protein [Gemmatimonadales bacterium]